MFKYIYAALVAIIFGLGLFSYYQDIKIESLGSEIAGLNTQLQNQDLLLKLNKTDCEVEKFEDKQEHTIKLEKEKKYEDVPSSLGSHTISL